MEKSTFVSRWWKPIFVWKQELWWDPKCSMNFVCKKLHTCESASDVWLHTCVSTSDVCTHLQTSIVVLCYVRLNNVMFVCLFFCCLQFVVCFINDFSWLYIVFELLVFETAFQTENSIWNRLGQPKFYLHYSLYTHKRTALILHKKDILYIYKKDLENSTSIMITFYNNNKYTKPC